MNGKRRRRQARARARVAMQVHDPRIDTLRDMLSYCRPMGSIDETAFVDRFIRTIPGVEQDPYGNHHVIIPDETGTAPIVWSAHTDTVHRASGRQATEYNATTMILELSRFSARSSSCLGADDTAGCFLLCEMIRSGVPGHYVFHYGEERGGIGSSALARSAPALLAGYTAAIALDRGGTGDVITRQSDRRTASDAFAGSLCSALNASGTLHYAPCDRGTYTDTAEYTGIVRECTNVSVGYHRAHSPYESLDVRHLFALLDVLVGLDTRSLCVERLIDDPADPFRDYASDDYLWDDDDDDDIIGGDRDLEPVQAGGDRELDLFDRLYSRAARSYKPLSWRVQ